MAAIAGVAGLALGAAGSCAVAGDVTGKAAIEQVVHDYILAHPEILTEAMLKLQERSSAGAITAERSALETPFAGAWAGSAKPRVTLVMFTDYACTYCRASAPDISRLLVSEPDLRIVFREIPILGPQSLAAARAALTMAKQDQGKYWAFHRGLYAAGRPDDATIAGLAAKAGVDPRTLAEQGKADDITTEIASNLKLAGRIGVDGTPGFVIGDRLLSGAVGYDKLKAAVDAAKG
jgi:protein-disulfide isomerase